MKKNEIPSSNGQQFTIRAMKCNHSLHLFIFKGFAALPFAKKDSSVLFLSNLCDL